MKEYYEPFENAEEVWFWFCGSIVARGDGLRKKITYREKRYNAFNKELPLGDQLDAILKAFDIVLQAGEHLPYELIDVIEKWQDIKSHFPKE